MPKRVSNQIKAVEQILSDWLVHYQDSEVARQAEALPLRRDMETLLTFVRDNKVVGIPGTGNMPLKAVREVTARFVEPPKLEGTIYGVPFRIRSETELWPLYFLRVVAEVGGLLKPAPARLWRLTRKGQDFLGVRPMLQSPYLLTTWWHKVNWLIAYPFAGMGEALPPFFSLFTLHFLLALPSETLIFFDDFADVVIAQTELTWNAPESSMATSLLHGSIERMVIDILVAFGAMECEYCEEPFGKDTISRLVAFQITPLGRALLEAVAISARGML
ncbi:MAG: hypothetical protein ONB44_05375 [candidate division KSB1 bacterium]|nr:hypothetical protein [candidate division KSB1 bacterium]MDZ7301555.1 hypothetical protein [candidate division KSB1 bacterium]MDZ7311029.1 hypothetical protein [candidate division KSB1 bacterium]